MGAFCAEFAAWFAENRPPAPDFLMPESFLEIGTGSQGHDCDDGSVGGGVGLGLGSLA